MSPRSPLFKSILWKAFAAGAFVGVTVQQPNRPRRSATVRFYFRNELNQLRFAAKLEETAPTLAHDHNLGIAIGKISGLLYFVELPLSSIRQIRHREPLVFALVGGVRGLKPMYTELSTL